MIGQLFGVVTVAILVYLVVRGPDWLRRSILVGAGALVSVLVIVLVGARLT